MKNNKLLKEKNVTAELFSESDILEKKVSRKEFIKLGAIGTILATAGSRVFSLHATEEQHITSKAAVRWGMVIDPKKCKEGCTDCITSCHEAHNVPDHRDKKNEVKWIWKENQQTLFPEKVSPYKKNGNNLPYITLCNHCDSPSCVRVCPTQATWKRNEDGIVMMDYHRCIGCRFCMAACPYGSRSFNYKNPKSGLEKINSSYPTRTIGVVEKCNFCSERISDNKEPLCVVNCKEKAIVFGNLNDPESEIRQILEKYPSERRKVELGTGPAVFYLS